MRQPEWHHAALAYIADTEARSCRAAVPFLRVERRGGADTKCHAASSFALFRSTLLALGDPRNSPFMRISHYGRLCGRPHEGFVRIAHPSLRHLAIDPAGTRSIVTQPSDDRMRDLAMAEAKIVG